MFSKLKQLTKETAIYGVSTMIGRFINYILVPFYTNIFAPAEYGIISNIYAYIAILNILFTYGMDSSYLKFAKSKEFGDDKDNFSTPYISILTTSVLFGLTFFIFKPFYAGLFSVPEQFGYLVYYVGVILVLDALVVLPFLNLRLENKPVLFATIKISNILLNVALNLILILLFNWGIEAIIVSNVLASALNILLLFPSIKSVFKIKFNTELFKRTLKFGLPFLPAGIALMILQVIDRPIMLYLTNLETVGIYQANYRLGTFMMLFVLMFQYAWQPFFMKNSEDENAKELFSKVLTYFTLAGTVMLVCLSLFIDKIVMMEFFGKSIIGKAYWSGLPIVPVVLLAYLFYGMYNIFSAGLYIKEKSGWVPLVSGIAAIVNIGVNFLLIPVLGIMGAALATLLSYFVMAAGIYLVSQNLFKIHYEYKKILIMLVTVIAIGSVYYYLLIENQITIYIRFGLLLFFFAVLIIFNVIEKKEIHFALQLLKGKRKNNGTTEIDI